MTPKWLTWAKELQALAQQGIEYSHDKYDVERFERIRSLSVEIMASYTDMDEMTIRDLFCSEKGYQTPKIDVRGIIIENDQILLVKETIDGKWALPGGWAEYSLSVKENVTKEVKEEAGLNVVAKHLIAVQDRRFHNTDHCPYGIYKMFVHCELIDGSFVPNIETEDSGYFSLDQLPPLSTNRNTFEQIAMCMNAVANKDLVTQFD